MIQTEPDVTDADVAAIRTVAEQYGLEVNDRRGQRTSGTYTAFVACVLCVFGRSDAGNGAEHCQRHLDERDGANQAIRRYAGPSAWMAGSLPG